MNISTGKWVLPHATVGATLLAAIAVVAISCSARAEPYLESSHDCSGLPLSQSERFKIIGWNGRVQRAQGEQIYSFRLGCRNSERDIIDVFLASDNSNRFKRDGNTLSLWVRNTRRSVKTREAGCSQVPKRVRTHPSNAEVRAACRYQSMPMACEIDMLAQVRWETRMVEECWRATYETREVPVWKAFPTGYAPLPRGARIVQVATNNAGAVSSPTGGSGIWPFLVVLLAAGGMGYYLQRRNQEAFQEKVASARSQMRDEGENFKASFHDQDFHSSASEKSYENFTSDNDFGTGGQTHHGTTQDEPKRSPDDLPETLEEACALLNVTPDTPHDEVNRIYKAMAMVWHTDRATGEEDRQRRETKMKQLNAAKEFIVGKR